MTHFFTAQREKSTVTPPEEAVTCLRRDWHFLREFHKYCYKTILSL